MVTEEKRPKPDPPESQPLKEATLGSELSQIPAEKTFTRHKTQSADSFLYKQHFALSWPEK